MVSEAVAQSVALALYVVLAFAFCIFSLLLAKIISPSRPNPRKPLTYECGQVPTGPVKSRFTVQYYPYAVVYAIYGALAIILLLAAPSVGAMPLSESWLLLLVVSSFAFALTGALAYLRPLVRPRRGGLGSKAA
jgi:NADH-quinone oxidoreductase subunit A